MAAVVAPFADIDSMGVSRTETKVFWDTTDHVPTMMAQNASASHFATWWSLETRADVLASFAALGLGLMALGASLLLLF